jgi:hypothetical protein
MDEPAVNGSNEDQNGIQGAKQKQMPTGFKHKEELPHDRDFWYRGPAQLRGRDKQGRRIISYLNWVPFGLNSLTLSLKFIISKEIHLLTDPLDDSHHPPL